VPDVDVDRLTLGDTLPEAVVSGVRETDGLPVPVTLTADVRDATPVADSTLLTDGDGVPDELLAADADTRVDALARTLALPVDEPAAAAAR
jgi:hypothetical protein